MVAVAMVRVSDVLLELGMLMLLGCVVSHGPDVANALDVPIEVLIRYADGELMNVPFEPGFRMRIGKGDWDGNKPWKDGNPWEAIPIEELVIKEAGQFLHQFNAEEVRLLDEKQESVESSVWCIDRERVYGSG